MLSSKLNRPAGACCCRCAPPPPPLTSMTPAVARVPSRDSCMAWSRAAARAASASSQGPAGPSRPERKRKPEWVRIMEEDADVDEDVARVLEGTDGDPDRIRENMRLELQPKDLYVTREGVQAPPKVQFRQVNPFKLWIWLQLVEAPSSREQELLESCVKAWFMLGKLGGFNSGNLQIFHNADDDQSYFDYDNDASENAMGSFLHDVGEVEFRGTWARFRVDMGTCDELALDVLLNMLLGFSKDFCGVRKVLVGGANKNWPVDDDDDEGKEYDIDPMKLPEGVAEELELLDEIAPELEKQMEKQRELLAAKRQGAAPGSLAAAAAEFQVEGRGRSGAQPPATVRSAAGWGASLARGRPARPSVGGSGDGQPSVGQGPTRQPGSPTKLPEGVSFISQEEFERSFPNRRGSAE